MRQAIVGVLWLICGVWFAVSVHVWVGIFMFALGVVWLAYAIRHTMANRAP